MKKIIAALFLFLATTQVFAAPSEKFQINYSACPQNPKLYCTNGLFDAAGRMLFQNQSIRIVDLWAAMGPVNQKMAKNNIKWLPVIVDGYLSTNAQRETSLIVTRVTSVGGLND